MKPPMPVKTSCEHAISLRNNDIVQQSLSHVIITDECYPKCQDEGIEKALLLLHPSQHASHRSHRKKAFGKNVH